MNSLTLFSEDEISIGAKCPKCGRVLKIRKANMIKNVGGFVLRPPVICPCRQTYMEIVKVEKSVCSQSAMGNKGGRTMKFSDIYDAAREGDLAEVKAFLAAGVNVNEQEGGNRFLNTALIYASEYGHLPVVLALLAAKADVNISNTDNGFTALIYASLFGHLEVVKALLAAGANVQKGGEKALMCASQKGHLAIVQALLAAEANVNTAQRDGETALICASRKGHLAIVQALIAAKADVNAKMEGTVMNRRSEAESHFTALMYASEEGHLEVVQALIAGKADVNICALYNRTALKLASGNGHTEVVKLLKSAGAK